jgi:hypothetical protein
MNTHMSGKVCIVDTIEGQRAARNSNEEDAMVIPAISLNQPLFSL